jgi:hypothetical protein
MPSSAVATPERAVGDLADERLAEGPLAALRRAEIGHQGHDLAPGQDAEACLDLGLVAPAHSGQRSGEQWPRTPASWAGSVSRIEGVRQAAIGLERLGHGQRVERARRDVDPVVLLQASLRDEHADRFDGVERDAVGAGHDGVRRGLRDAGDQAGEQLAHRLVGQAVQRQRQEVAAPGAPVRAPFQQLRSRQRHEVQRVARGPLQEVLDEVDHPGIGPLEILEDEHRRSRRGDPLEERAPGREQGVAPAGR